MTPYLCPDSPSAPGPTRSPVGLLDSFERGLERAVNGAFAKTFRSGIQPVEIASALRRELDTQASVVSRDRILVPSVFTVSLNPADLDRMRALGSALDSELDALVKKHAASQGYSFAGLVIRDDYTSSQHARLMLWGEQWMLQDLDSTNGTWLDGERVHAPVPVKVGSPIKVGATTFELRA